MNRLFSRLFCSLMIALMITVFCAPVQAGESGDLLARIRQKGYIVIATEGDWAPWTYHDETNELVGLDVELGKAIAAYIGVEARFAETNWDAILAGVDSGRFDIACNGVSVTEDRMEKYYFSTPYIYAPTVLVVRGDNESIQSFSDLKGKKTANTVSSIYAAIAEENGATVLGVDKLEDTIELVMHGRADATLNSRVSINDYLLEHPDANLKIVAELAGDIVAVPVRRDDDALTLMEAINKALEAMRQDGRLAELSARYFNGLDLTKPEE